MHLKQRLLILAWGMYDLANQSFAVNIVTFYFVLWVTVEKQTPELFHSISIALSMFFVACLAPFLGRLSDIIRKHRFFLSVFTALSIIFTISMGFTKSVFWGLLFFAIANFGCQAAIVFYNALLINVAPPEKIGLISGFGKMLGYWGAILCLYLISPFVEASNSYHAAFIPTGIFFLLFSLPCLLFVKDKPIAKDAKLAAFFDKGRLLFSLRQFLKENINIIRFGVLADFFKVVFFCLCVVNIMIFFMMTYITKVFALSLQEKISLFVFSAIFASLASLFSGYISDRIGYKRALLGVLLLWALCLLFGSLVRGEMLFWVIGPLVGIALGSTWAVSRALVAKLVSPENIGQIFGLFLFVGYFAAMFGVLIWGGLVFLLAPLEALGYRIALASLLFFLLPSFYFLRRVKISPTSL